MNPLRYGLLPFSILYGTGVAIRNKLYDAGIFKSTRFEIPVIVIGNLSAGGTGKTPMAEYLLRMLKEEGYTPALLSRGYGRKTKGFRIVTTTEGAEMSGDEPYQIKKKFPDIVVVVCEARVEGIKQIQAQLPQVDVIILDDAYQHRALEPGFRILLTDYRQPYYRDWLLPAGMLRESAAGHKRADIIIMTKCPAFPNEQQRQLFKQKLDASPQQPVYFTRIAYALPVQVDIQAKQESIADKSDIQQKAVFLFAGIAQPAPLVEYLEQQGCTVTFMRFADHHDYTQGDMLKIKTSWEQLHAGNKILMTTEKDWRRLENSPFCMELTGMPLYFLPVQVDWKPEEKLSFDENIRQYVSRNQGIR